MPDLFTDDGGSNTAPYETWAKAATAFATAVAASSAGDRLVIGHDHTETPGASTTYTLPGTAAAPNLIISALSSAGGSTVTYTKSSVDQIDLSGGNYDLTIAGFGKFYGVGLNIGQDLKIQSSPQAVFFEDSTIELSRAGSANLIIGSGSGQNEVILKNTDVNFSGSGANSFIQPSTNARFSWLGGVYSINTTMPTALFDSMDRDVVVNIAGVDLSALTSAILDIGSAAKMTFSLRHCLLNSGVALTTGTIVDNGSSVLMVGCDDSTGNDLYRLEYIDFYGSTVHDDAIYRDDGASDGTTNISWKMVSTANAAEFTEPTKSPPIPGVWVDATGSTTFTVSIAWDNAADLQDDEVWLELEYLEASADTDSAFVDDRMADITATPADQTNNTEAWTGTGGFGTLNRVEVAVTVTIGRVGPVIARVCLAKPSTTIYVDPKVEKS